MKDTRWHGHALMHAGMRMYVSGRIDAKQLSDAVLSAYHTPLYYMLLGHVNTQKAVLAMQHTSLSLLNACLCLTITVVAASSHRESRQPNGNVWHAQIHRLALLCAAVLDSGPAAITPDPLLCLAAARVLSIITDISQWRCIQPGTHALFDICGWCCGWMAGACVPSILTHGRSHAHTF